MTVRLAPSWSAAALRVAALALAAALILSVMWLDRGPPSAQREVRQDEVRIFQAKPRGIVQFVFEAALLGGIAWFGRRKLNVKL